MPHISVRARSNTRLLPLLGAYCLLSFEGCTGAIDGPPSTRGTSPGALPAGPHAGAAASPMVRAADAMMQAANPTLFEVSMRYFPETAAISGPPRLFRLTRTQLDATTQVLLPMQFKGSAVDALPRDPLQTNYEYADNLSFNPANFTPYTNWVAELAAGVRTNPASVIDCAAKNNATNCLEDQARLFVKRAFRDVVTDADLLRFTSFFSSSVTEAGLPAATGDLVDVTLTSPHYVFRDEVGANGAPLSAAQQLQNISYALADAPPEALGLGAMSAAAQLSTPDAVARTVDQVLASPQARQKLMRFFIAWLEVRDPDQFTIATDVFPEFTPELAAALVEETRAFLNKQLSGAAPKLKDVTQSTRSFVSDALASIYGTKKTGKTSEVDLDPTQRLGIFTLPGVIASHSGPTTTRLVKRGVFFTRKVMCLPLGQPPPGVNTTLPMTAGATERQKVESVTNNATCLGCHAYINPFGFMQENYDPLGRWRTTDQGMPIDASMSVDFLDEGKLTTKAPVEALKTLTGSLRFQQCFARQLFRFYMGRDEIPGDDPTLRQMFFGFANQGEQSLVKLLQTLAVSTTFSQRTEAP